MTAALALCVVLLGTVSFRTEIGVGADYTTQRYTVGIYDTLNWDWREEDTLNIETEGRTGLTLRLGVEGPGRRFDAVNAAGFSTRSARNALGLWYEQELGPALSLRAGNDAELRHYHAWFPALADTLYGGRDYWSNNSRLELRYRPTERLRLNATEAVEFLRYAEPDSYHYNYHLNRARLTGWWEAGLFTTVGFGTGWTRRWSPQDRSRDYDDIHGQAGLEHIFEAGFRAGLDNELRRRAYRGAGFSYWEDALTLSAGASAGAFEIELENEANWLMYDTVSPVYPSLFENGLRLSFDLPLADGVRFRAGPGLDIGVGIHERGDEDYRELSLRAALDIFGTDRLWLSLEDRVGLRRYPYADTTWQTDYAFNELSLFGSWTALRGRAGELRVEAMASVSPEWHARATDNFALAIYSLDLKYGF
ncbi:MAG TPA: hypothetical protein ENN51_05890 [candidate division WOR-3 bacterium]|uniref:Uncharacterized protein n=1 Tax=candidate division WOR-3 bacterium TaxID=2052148 RepID=A0A7V0T6N0_UNCW3|nr:hypothetical protein [candidate division WOR-3 bacterium]